MFLDPSGFVPLLGGDEDEVDKDSVWNIKPHFWRKAHILDINFDFTKLEDEPESGPQKEIIFPGLTRLRIQLLLINNNSNALANHVTTQWKAPALRVLSLQFVDVPGCYSLLRWSADVLTTLELSDVEFESLTTPIRFPSLISIIIEDCLFQGWEEVIEAPLLAKLSFRDRIADRVYRRQRGSFAQSLMRLIKQYPTCSCLSFFKSRGGSFSCEQESWKAGKHDLVFGFDPNDPQARPIAIKNGWIPL